MPGNQGVALVANGEPPQRLKIPPHSIEAEQSVLGAVLLDDHRWAEVRDVLDADDFYRPGHRIIFRAMGDLIAKGQPVDITTLYAQMPAAALDAAGGVAYLAELFEDTPSAANAAPYARIVKERSICRQTAIAASDMAAAALDGDEALIAEARARLSAIDAGAPARECRFNDLPPMEPIEWLARDLIRERALFGLVGEPGAGKSHASRGLVATVASSGGEFFGRITQGGKALYIDYQNGDDARPAFEELQRGGLSLDDLIVDLDAKRPETLAAAAAELRAMLKRNPGVKLVFLDGLVDWARIADVSDYAEVNDALGKLREIAADFDCAIGFQHHTAKHNPKSPLGSQAILGAVDCLLAFTLKGEGPDATFAVRTMKVRRAKHLPVCNVKLRDDGLPYLDGTVSETTAVEDAEDWRSLILAHLAEHGETPRAELIKAIPGRAAGVRAVIETLLRDGLVVQSGKRGGRTDPCRYSLPPNHGI